MKALVLVDIQNDFVKGGALAVPDGDAVVPIANRLQPYFPLVVATQDYHPAHHGSFAANHPDKQIGEVIELNGLSQILWPVHCVQGTSGSAFVESLSLEHVQAIFPKGTDPDIDSYSGFFDNGKRKATGLHHYLQQQGISELYILGLATDYCVKFTAIDAAELGYQTYLIVDACRGVNLQPDDSEKAITDMQLAGVLLTDSDTLIRTYSTIG